MPFGLDVERDFGEIEFLLQDEEGIRTHALLAAQLLQPFTLSAPRGETELALAGARKK